MWKLKGENPKSVLPLLENWGIWMTFLMAFDFVPPEIHWIATRTVQEKPAVFSAGSLIARFENQKAWDPLELPISMTE